MWIIAFWFFAGCATSIENTKGTGGNAAGSAKAQQKLNRLQNLRDTKGLQKGEDVEMEVLRRGGSEREAELAKNLYTRGLSDDEAKELATIRSQYGSNAASLNLKTARIQDADETVRASSGHIAPTSHAP